MGRNKRRHSNGFGYIGSGNSHSVINQSSKKAFSKLKGKLNAESLVHFNLDFLSTKLSKQEREKIKEKIRKEDILKTKKTIIVFIIIAISLSFILYYFISILTSN